MTRDVKVIVSGMGIHLCFENADCEFTDRLTVGQARRLKAELEKAIAMADPRGKTDKGGA